MADNLETYFNKHLTDDTPGEDNWNVPSDEVWENVLPEIQKTNGVFLPWKYLYLIGGIMAILLLALFFWLSDSSVGSNMKTDSFTTIDEKQKDEPAHQITNDIKENFITESKPDNPKSTQNNSVKTESAAYVEKEISIPKSKIMESNYVNTSPQEKLNKESKKSNHGTYSIFLKNENQNEYIQITRLSPRKFDLSTVIFGSNSLNSHSNQPVDLIDLSVENKEPFDNKGRFGIGIYYAPSFTSTSLNGNPNSGKIETDNQLFFTNNWGLELKYFISNRFSLYAAIGRSEINTFSKSLTNFDYNLSTEYLMPDGVKENTSPVMMLTPFGEIHTEITYQFPGTDELPNGEVMNSVMETSQQVRYIAIPFGVDYNIMRFSHFDWFASGGLNYNRALKDATQFNSRILHHGSDMDVVAEKIMGNPTLTKSFLGFSAGTGLNYQFSKSFQISGSANYFGNITKVNVEDNLSTYVNGFNLKIGIFYLF